MARARQRHSDPRHPLVGVLSVIQPRGVGRGSVGDRARDMVAARLALAMREDPPEAMQLALMMAFRRGRPQR